MRGRLMTAALLVAVGTVWIGQGLGVVGGSSFMVDDRRWTAAGLVAVVLGVAIAVRSRRSGPPGG